MYIIFLIMQKIIFSYCFIINTYLKKNNLFKNIKNCQFQINYYEISQEKYCT